jgi:TPR repeat protein
MTALGELLWTLPEDPEEGGWLTRVRALAEQGEWAEAEMWFRKAADAGDAGAMGCLGGLLWCTDQLEGERWLLKAAEAGNTSAMTQLGIMLEVRGALDEAEAWLRRAVDSEDRDARWWLCNFLKQNGKADEARQWEDQEPLYVGVTFSDSGHNPQSPAEDWCHTAAQAGDTGAMTALGDLLRQRGRDDEAQHWYCKAATDANAAP